MVYRWADRAGKSLLFFRRPPTWSLDLDPAFISKPAALPMRSRTRGEPGHCWWLTFLAKETAIPDHEVRREAMTRQHLSMGHSRFF